MVAMWFRRDLRLEDNAALAAAVASGQPILPMFIFDDEILQELPRVDARVTFFYGLLESMNADIAAAQGSIAGFEGTPMQVFDRLLSEQKITAVYANADYEPYATARDAELADFFAGRNVEFKLFRDHLIFEPGEILKPDGSPYVVFTPFSKKWHAQMQEERLRPIEVGHVRWARHDYRFPSLEEIGFVPSKISVPKADTSQSLVANYPKTRDYPSKNTSRLGPHLRFGSISIRRAVRDARQSNQDTFLNELIWREFFAHVLYHYPATVNKSFRPQYDNIQWRNNEQEFTAWKLGMTGYPLVDAGMRELAATGFMHNRVRMVTASFLCKHLLIDWRWGEAHFALNLLDYEQSSNVGNWQWAAGSGTDAAPYFRIFNPSEQAKKFDGAAQYILKWIPEYRTPAYPAPIVEHAFARQRCLEVYKSALG